MLILKFQYVHKKREFKKTVLYRYFFILQKASVLSIFQSSAEYDKNIIKNLFLNSKSFLETMSGCFQSYKYFAEYVNYIRFLTSWQQFFEYKNLHLERKSSIFSFLCGTNFKFFVEESTIKKEFTFLPHIMKVAKECLRNISSRFAGYSRLSSVLRLKPEIV